jgi:hypothetical protein
MERQSSKQDLAVVSAAAGAGLRQLPVFEDWHEVHSSQQSQRLGAASAAGGPQRATMWCGTTDTLGAASAVDG